MSDRRQIADEIWQAFKHWEGERKFALRAICKHLTGRDDMSSWHYQVMQHTDDNGDPYLAIHEAYKLHDGKLGWTQRPVPIEAESVSDLRIALINILRDLERHGVKDAKTGEIVQAGTSVVQI